MIRCSVAPATSASLTIIAALALTTACGGGAPPPTQAPSAVAKPAASAPVPAPPDLTPVAPPLTLVASGRLAKPSATLATVHDWTHLPMPQSDQATELLLGEALGPLIDLDQPIDVAFAFDPAAVGKSLDEVTGGLFFAVAAGVKDADAAKTALADHFKLLPGDNGALLIPGLGNPPRHDSDDEQEEEDADFRRTCELAPAFGASATRLVCAIGNDKALSVLGPWLTRGAPRLPSGADVHVDFRMQPVKPMVAEQGKMMGALLGSMLASSLPLPSLREVVTATVLDLTDFLVDVDTEALDVTVADGGVRAKATLALTSVTSTMARFAMSNVDHSGPVPPIFWQMPADADAVDFTRGFDDAILARPRELLLKVADEGLAREGVKTADRKSLLDALAKLAVAPPSAFAAGVDLDAVAKAMAANAPADPSASNDLAHTWPIIPQLFGWYVGEMDAPGDKMSAAWKDFVAAWGRPGLVSALREKLHGAAPPTIRSVPLPKAAAAWPKGATHYVLTFTPSFPTQGGANRKGAKDKDKGGGGALKPLVVHALIVPEASRTWVGVSADEALATARLGAAMAGSGQTLASRSDMASFKDLQAAGAAGFFTMAGLGSEAAVFAAALGAPWKDIAEPIESLRALPHRALTPITITATTTSPTAPTSSVVSLDIPRAVVDDLLVIIAQHGGF
jgi:hypothetical protein